MKITTDTTEWDAFVAEATAFAGKRRDVVVASLFTRYPPIFCLVAAPPVGDIIVKLVPEQNLRAAFEKLRAKYPAMEDGK